MSKKEAVPEQSTTRRSVRRVQPPRGVARPYLLVINSVSPYLIGKLFKIENEELIVGRSSSSEVQILEEGVSRRHCKVVVQADGRCVLYDLESTNGTYVNGKPIRDHVLTTGDRIQIGTTAIFKYVVQDDFEARFQEEIYESAVRDGLTGLFNRKYYLSRLKSEYSHAARHQWTLRLPHHLTAEQQAEIIAGLRQLTEAAQALEAAETE